VTSGSPTHQNTLPQTKMEMKSDSYGSITSLATTVSKCWFSKSWCDMENGSRIRSAIRWETNINWSNECVGI